MKTIIVLILVFMCGWCWANGDKYGDTKICDNCGKEFILYEDGMRSQVCDDVRYYCFECLENIDFNENSLSRLKQSGFGGN